MPFPNCHPADSVWLVRVGCREPLLTWRAALGFPGWGGEELLLLGHMAGSMAGKAGLVVQKAHPVGLVSSWVSQRNQQWKNLQIFLESLQLSVFKDNIACFLFAGSCLLHCKLGFLKAGKEHGDQ